MSARDVPTVIAEDVETFDAADLPEELVEALEKELDALATKRCGCCRENKPLDAFSRSYCLKDGRQNRCKACASAYQRERDRLMKLDPLAFEAQRQIASEARELRKRDPERLRRYNESQRAYQRRKKRDPEYLARFNEYHRIYQTARRQQRMKQDSPIDER